MTGNSSTGAPASARTWGAILIGALLALIGLWLTGGGAWLLWLGGSAYYLLAGIGCLASSWFYLTHRQTRGAWVYLLVFAATCLWAFSEAGTDFWQLLPRIGGPAAMAVLLVLHGLFADPTKRRIAWATLTVSLLAAAAILFDITRLPTTAGGMLSGPIASATSEDWTAFGRTQGGDRYSTAAQITSENVGSLEVAWTLRTGDLLANFPKQPGAHTFQATPLKIGNLVYVCTPHNLVIAADADTGKQRWRYDPKLDLKRPGVLTCRGVSYSETGADAGQCARRIIYATLDARMIALDAMTGKPCPDFGDGGSIRLTEGLGEVPEGGYVVTSPPAIANGVAVIGSFVFDGVERKSPSGVVRGYDVANGELVWAWDPSAEDENRKLAAGEEYSRGTANSWAVMSADPELGLVYVPTGNVSPDYVSKNRTALEKRYTSSIVALDSRTGKRRWHFQTVHNDLWDYDVPAQPVLFDMPIPGGSSVPAVAQPTKQGEIFILDRATGKPLTEVKELPAPKGTLAGEPYSPTQPEATGFPSPLSKAKLDEKDMWGMTPLDQLLCRIRYRQARYDGRFTPPAAEQLTIQYPGNYGIMNFGSVTIGNSGRTMFVNSAYMAMTNRLTPYPGPGKGPPARADFSPQRDTPWAANPKVMLSPFGIPCNAPPWGKLTAIDLASRTIAWQKPFGTTSDAAPLGIAVPGAPNIAGSVATAGGLLFIGASIDNYIRAYDTKSGAEVWRARLPAGGQAAPISYVSDKTGRQYIVIAAGGHMILGTDLGDYLIAYALPDK